LDECKIDQIRVSTMLFVIEDVHKCINHAVVSIYLINIGVIYWLWNKTGQSLKFVISKCAGKLRTIMLLNNGTSLSSTHCIIPLALTVTILI